MFCEKESVKIKVDEVGLQSVSLLGLSKTVSQKLLADMHKDLYLLRLLSQLSSDGINHDDLVVVEGTNFCACQQGVSEKPSLTAPTEILPVLLPYFSTSGHLSLLWKKRPHMVQVLLGSDARDC